MEDNLWRKTTFDGRQPSVEDNQQPLVEDNLQWKMTFGDDLPFTITAQLSPNRNGYQLSQPEIEFAIVEMYAALCMHACVDKNTFLGKDH